MIQNMFIQQKISDIYFYWSKYWKEGFKEFYLYSKFKKILYAAEENNEIDRIQHFSLCCWDKAYKRTTSWIMHGALKIRWQSLSRKNILFRKAIMSPLKPKPTKAWVCGAILAIWVFCILLALPSTLHTSLHTVNATE